MQAAIKPFLMKNLKFFEPNKKRYDTQIMNESSSELIREKR